MYIYILLIIIIVIIITIIIIIIVLSLLFIHTHILYHPYQYIHYTYFALWWSFLFLVQKSPATSKKSSHETFGATELSGIDRKSQ